MRGPSSLLKQLITSVDCSVGWRQAWEEKGNTLSSSATPKSFCLQCFTAVSWPGLDYVSMWELTPASNEEQSWKGPSQACSHAEQVIWGGFSIHGHQKHVLYLDVRHGSFECISLSIICKQYLDYASMEAIIFHGKLQGSLWHQCFGYSDSYDHHIKDKDWLSLWQSDLGIPLFHGIFTGLWSRDWIRHSWHTSGLARDLPERWICTVFFSHS